MPQEFLASFAVDIDEGGVNRLQSVLQQNRDLAAGVASAFDAARASMMAFIQSATEELSAVPFFSRSASVGEALDASGSFSVDLDFTRASKQLETFLTGAKKQMRLTADASGIVSAASAALSRVRSMLAGANLTLKVNVETEGNLPSGSVDSGPSASPGSLGPAPVRMLATGGRFSSPTRAEIAEDGDPEYVVPVKKEQEAIPLVRSLLSELSASARESLRDVLPASGITAGGHPERSKGSPFTLSAIPGLFSSAAAAAAPVIQQSSRNSVQAPVNIHVEAAAADPEAVGRSIYDTAEHYLLRTLQSAV